MLQSMPVELAGEDGTIRAWTTDRGKVCGIRKFFLCSNSAATSDYDVEGPSEGILPDPKHETMGVQEAEFPRRGDVPIPLSSLASCRSQSLLAVGMCHGVVHLIFVRQVISI